MPNPVADKKDDYIEVDGQFRRVTHPLLQDKITHMRRNVKLCPTRTFNELMREAGVVLACEVTRHEEVEEVKIPVGDMESVSMKTAGPFLGSKMKKKTPAVIVVLRSGGPMADEVASILRTTRTGHIGVHWREEDQKQPEDKRNPTRYLSVLPFARSENETAGQKLNTENRDVLVIDPVIVTGRTAAVVIETLRSSGIPDSKIKILTLVVGDVGKKYLTENYNGITIYCAEWHEPVVNDDLSPGFGSVSNRLFRTI